MDGRARIMKPANLILPLFTLIASIGLFILYLLIALLNTSDVPSQCICHWTASVFSTSTSTLTTMLSRSHSNPTIFHSDLFGWMQLGTMPHILEVKPLTSTPLKSAGRSMVLSSKASFVNGDELCRKRCGREKHTQYGCVLMDLSAGTRMGVFSLRHPFLHTPSMQT